MGLLFLNAFKGLKNHKLQMLSIIALIFLGTGIYTMMNTSLDRIENRYYSYLKEQNVEDFSFVINTDYDKDFTYKQVLSFLNNELKNIKNEDKQIVLAYANCLNNKTSICNEYLYYSVNNIFNDNNIINFLNKEKLEKLSDKYDFTYEMQQSKTNINNGISTKIIPYKKDNILNKPYLLEGSFPKNNDEITMLKAFAKEYNIKINDTYKILDKSYKVVGFTYASDYIYPMISINIPIFEQKKNNIIFMTNDAYLDLNLIKEDVISAKFNYQTDPKSRMEIEIIEDENGNFIPKTSNPATDFFVKEKDTVTRNLETISRSIRIDLMQVEFESTKTFAQYFLYLLLSISIVIIIIINKKRIEDERLQIGVLKSLGYKKIPIAVSYLVYPIFGSLAGGLLGYFTGFLTNDFLTNVYLSYFNVVLTDSIIDKTYLLQCIFIPMIVLSLLGFIISLLMLKKKPLDLLREGSNLKVNKFTKIINKITSKMKFENKFKYSLASRSIGKLIIVAITSLSVGLLITLTLIGANLFNNLVDDSLKGFNYDYMVSYRELLTTTTNEDDYILQTTSKVVRVEDKYNNEKELLEEDYEITLSGIDSNLNYLTIKDKTNKNLINYLADKTIIINANIKDLLNVNIGDYLVFNINNKDVSYEIVGIENNYVGATSYIKRSNLSNDLGFASEVYNLKYTKNSNYSDMSKLDSNEVDNIYMVFSFNDLKDNINSQMKVYNDSLYIVIAFAALMALIIIAVIANIIVLENKKTISLMKVMGYYSNEISRIILNIYTPIIIIFYLISVPIMKLILERIVMLIASDMEMSIPITISVGQVLLGLVSLLISYFIAILLSKKTLNKVPLSIALKRE